MGRVMGLKALNGLVHVRLFGRESERGEGADSLEMMIVIREDVPRFIALDDNNFLVNLRVRLILQ